jgi:lipopolysaccharide cholinephosphotransferase
MPPPREMEKPIRIAVFGAGHGGTNFMSALPGSIKVVALLDNNRALHGSVVQGLTVFDPQTFNFGRVDEVYIASMWATEIQQQLTDQLGVDPAKIRTPPKHLLKREGQLPFMIPEYRQQGLSMLRAMIDLLEERGMEVYVNHGTLLGLLRDQDLIHWDDDMDISVHADHHQTCEMEHLQLMQGMSHGLHGGRFTAAKISSQDGESVGLNFKYFPANTDGMALVVSIAYYRVVEDMAHEYLCICPARHYQPGAFATVAGYAPFPVLTDAEAFLTFRYGNWRQPDPAFSFAQHILPDSTRGGFHEVPLGTLDLE